MMHNEPLMTEGQIDGYTWIKVFIRKKCLKNNNKKTLTLAGLASLAMGHVVEDVFHGTAMG